MSPAPAKLDSSPPVRWSSRPPRLAGSSHFSWSSPCWRGACRWPSSVRTGWWRRSRATSWCCATAWPRRPCGPWRRPPLRASAPLVFAAAARLYVRVGLATGVLIALAALGIAAAVLDGDLAADASIGGLGLGAVSAAGIAASVYLDALRAERLLVRAAGLEIAGVAVYLALMLALILSGAGLGAVIAASGAMPLLSGLLSLAEVRRRGLPFRRGGDGGGRASEIVPTAGWLLVVELSTLVSYALDRVILGAFRSPARVGLYEGPLRAHNLLYALGGALAVPTVPTASRYVANRRPPPAARARAARHPVHAGAVRAAVRDPDGAGPPAARRLARGPLRRGRRGAHDPRLLLDPLRRPGGHAGVPGGGGAGARGGADHVRGRGAEPRAHAGAHPRARPRGPGGGHGGGLHARLPVPAAPGAARCRGPALGDLARRAWVPAYSLGAAAGRGCSWPCGCCWSPRGWRRSWGSASLRVGAYWITYWVLWLDPGERALVRGLARPGRG